MSSFNEPSLSPSDKTTRAVVIGEPHEQRGCALLTIAGELRNLIYDYVFQDGRKANLAFVLACRQIHEECPPLYTRSVATQIGPIVQAYRTFDLWADPPYLTGPVGISHPETVDTVHCRLGTYSHDIPIRVSHRLGLRPTTFVQDIHPWTSVPWTWRSDMPALDRPDVFLGLSAMARGQHQHPDQREINQHLHRQAGSLFAQFLLNPRLDTWKARHFTRDGQLGNELTMTIQNREDFTRELSEHELTWTRETAEEWVDSLVLQQPDERISEQTCCRVQTQEFLVNVGHLDLKSEETKVFAEIKVEWMTYHRSDEWQYKIRVPTRTRSAV